MLAALPNIPLPVMVRVASDLQKHDEPQQILNIPKEEQVPLKAAISSPEFVESVNGEITFRFYGLLSEYIKFDVNVNGLVIKNVTDKVLINNGISNEYTIKSIDGDQTFTNYQTSEQMTNTLVTKLETNKHFIVVFASKSTLESDVEMKDNLSSNINDDDDIKVLPYDSYAVNYEHVKEKVTDFADEYQTDEKEHDCRKLVDILKKIDVSGDELSMWRGYSGGEIFSSKNCAATRLESVVGFAEGNKSCSAHIKQKLRVITKMIMEKGEKNSGEYVHILLLLASHGNVCNVMKEVAIGNAYGIMTDKLDDFVQSQSLEQQIRKVLRDYRVLLVETLFHSLGMTNNTHYIAGFHNVLAADLGVTPYNDPDICTPYTSKVNDWKKGLLERYWATMYTKENIISHIFEQIAEKKIGYQKIVDFLKEHRPKDIDSMAWLQKAIDIDTGKINDEYIALILEKMNIFMVKTDEWKPIEKCWDDIKE